MNKIEVFFAPCIPKPSRGYNIIYRVQGSSGSYINAGNFFTSPATFYDLVNEPGTCYEGYIKSDCSTLLGNPIPWSNCIESGAGSGSLNILGTIINTAHGIIIDTTQSIPCDVTFPIEGFYDDHGVLTEFAVDVTIPAGTTSGSLLSAVPGIIDCIKPTTAGTTQFIFSASCGGVNYTFILEIDSPC